MSSGSLLLISLPAYTALAPEDYVNIAFIRLTPVLNRTKSLAEKVYSLVAILQMVITDSLPTGQYPLKEVPADAPSMLKAVAILCLCSRNHEQ